jgi:hypothetical protein
LGLISKLMGWQVDGEYILVCSSCFVTFMITLYTYHIQNCMITWHVYYYDILQVNLLSERYACWIILCPIFQKFELLHGKFKLFGWLFFSFFKLCSLKLFPSDLFNMFLYHIELLKVPPNFSMATICWFFLIRSPLVVEHVWTSCY